VVEHPGFLLRQHHDAPRTVGEPLEHGVPSPFCYLASRPGCPGWRTFHLR